MLCAWPRWWAVQRLARWPRPEPSPLCSSSSFLHPSMAGELSGLLMRLSARVARYEAADEAARAAREQVRASWGARGGPAAVPSERWKAAPCCRRLAAARLAQPPPDQTHRPPSWSSACRGRSWRRRSRSRRRRGPRRMRRCWTSSRASRQRWRQRRSARAAATPPRPRRKRRPRRCGTSWTRRERRRVRAAGGCSRQRCGHRTRRRRAPRWVGTAAGPTRVV
jgi:hypothetical protein